MKRYLFFQLFFIAIQMPANHLAGQNDSSVVNYTFDYGASLFFQTNEEVGAKVHSDYTTNIYGQPLKPKYNEVTDNPFRHNAFYTLLKNSVSVRDKYSFDLDILFEHRGISYGLYDMNNIVIVPYYKFNIDESFNLFENTVNIKFNIGCYQNGKVHNGLKVYNLDYQGAYFNLSWKNLFLEYSQIGDLSRSIGLQLEEYFDYALGYKFTENKNRYFKLGINLSINNYGPAHTDSLILKPHNMPVNATGIYYYPVYGAWCEYKTREKDRLYFQYEIRKIPYINITENSGILLGGEFRFGNPKMSITLNPEFRYYGWMYNFNHRNDSVSYREKPSDPNNLYSNTVGESLYPLKNYYNQFSQWAVYTEYQCQNIAGIEMRLNFKRQIYRKIDLTIETECCTLLKEYKRKNSRVFTYFFYTAQLSYNVENMFRFGVGANNKSMNLDKHYNTFYMRKEPIVHFFIRKELARN